MMSNRNTTTTMTENDEGTTVTITTTDRNSPASGDEDGDHSEDDDRDEADEGNRNEDGQQPPSSSSLPPLDLTKNPPKRKKKTTTAAVPRYAQPTEKESFRRLGEEGIISSFTRSIEEAEQQQQQQEPSPDATMTTTSGDEKLESLTHRRRLVPKPPAKNEPKVLIKTRPSASLGFASTLILPVSARTTGNNNRNDEILSNDNTTNGSGEVKNIKKATTPRVAKRKWMIN